VDRLTLVLDGLVSRALPVEERAACRASRAMAAACPHHPLISRRAATRVARRFLIHPTRREGGRDLTCDIPGTCYGAAC
jgi:hypothetical protein